MEAVQEGVSLLALAARKGLIAQESAIVLKKDLESGVHPGGAQPMADLLVEKGHITAAQADMLVGDFAKMQGPKVIGGHQLISKLGQGGMGAVFKATQLSMQREVALKLLAPHLARDKEFVERFVREARAAGKVQHANVIGCYDVGVDKGTPYMSLELVAGGDALQKCKTSGGRLGEREALTIVRDCARGLAAIHKAGLIHRDIKPANIFLTEDGIAKLADLGLARSTSGDDKMTQTGATIGSPAYMSPEQAKGVHDLDIRTDIYSLGASLFHLVCGEPPFSASSVFATVAKVMNDPLPDPRAKNPSLSPACATLLRKTMQKDRAQRFQSPEEMLEACESLLSGTVATALPVRSDRQRAQQGHHHHHHARQAPPAKRRPMALYIGGGLAAVVIIAVAASALGGSKEVTPTVVADTPAEPTPTVAAQPRTYSPPPNPAPTPRVETPTVTATPVADRVREVVRDRVEERREARVYTAPTETPAAPTVPAAPAAPVEPAIPDWSAAGIATLDHVLSGDLTAAAQSAKALPREYRDAVDRVASSRSDLIPTWIAHKAAIIAAKPVLPSMITGVVISDLTDKNIMFRDPRMNAEGGHSWTKIDDKDRALLRAIVEGDSPTNEDRQRLTFLRLTDDATLRAADSKDPTIAALQTLAKVKGQVATAEAKKAEEARAAQEAANRLAAVSNRLEDRTRRVIRNIAEVTVFDPMVISQPITTDIELRDFVVLTKGAILQGGRLIPTAGAVVLNLTERTGYQPVELRGMPFVSIGGSPAQNVNGGRVGEGIRFSNAIFYGNVAIDGMTCGDFDACSFIGSGLQIGKPFANVYNLTGSVRPGQIRHSDFVRMTFNDALSVSATDQCFFMGNMFEAGKPPRGYSDIPAWDMNGEAQVALNRVNAAGQPRIQMRPLPGRSMTPFGADAQAIGVAIDAMLTKWSPQIEVWAR